MLDLNLAARMPKWSPRQAFGPSQLLSHKLFACGGGYYLRTNPRFGEGDPVFAVCWAESDYWALRAFQSPPFSGDLDVPAREYAGPPSLERLGKPSDLSFRSVVDFENERSRGPAGAMIVATFRITDGAVLSCDVRGADRVTYLYQSPNPASADEPSAIEIRLGDRAPEY